MDSMLRPRPQPLEEVCLSFDVGSMNCGVCLFDGSTDAQTILYTKKLQLLDEHATVIHDVKPVKRYLDDLTQIVRTLLKERPFWVLIEEQFTQFKTDPEAKQFQMVFTIQMESCISMYYLQQGIEVRTIHSTKRFAFFGLCRLEVRHALAQEAACRGCGEHFARRIGAGQQICTQEA